MADRPNSGFLMTYAFFVLCGCESLQILPLFRRALALVTIPTISGDCGKSHSRKAFGLMISYHKFYITGYILLSVYMLFFMTKKLMLWWYIIMVGGVLIF